MVYKRISVYVSEYAHDKILKELEELKMKPKDIFNLGLLHAQQLNQEERFKQNTRATIAQLKREIEK